MAKCKKEIADKVELYQALKEQQAKLYKEIKDYFEKELGAEEFGEPFITDMPKGELQYGDEYCNQRTIYEDWYEGEYYYAVGGEENKYVGYEF